MEFWKEVRRRVLTKEISKRAACQEYGLGLRWTPPTGPRNRLFKVELRHAGERPACPSRASRQPLHLIPDLGSVDFPFCFLKKPVNHCVLIRSPRYASAGVRNPSDEWGLASQ